MKNFDIPDKYKSNIISRIKQSRKLEDPRKKDFSPTVIDFGEATFLIARHLGFVTVLKMQLKLLTKQLMKTKINEFFCLAK